MKWWVFILLPFHLLAQETYTNCGDIIPQNYQVSYDADKIYYWDISDGEVIYNQGNSITVQWPDSIGTYIISVYTTRFGCEGDTSHLELLDGDNKTASVTYFNKHKSVGHLNTMFSASRPLGFKILTMDDEVIGEGEI